MPLNNLEYLYEHLPARFRREDKELFLKRFLQFFGETLNDWDEIFDNFADNINPSTAAENWVKFWLENLFGWSWFPEWFTLADKRNLYANFARHLARRGTAEGIELFLADFRLTVKVHNQPAFYGELVWGEQIVAVAEPLLIAIEIVKGNPVNSPEMTTLGEAVWGESPYTTFDPMFTPQEINALLAFQQPQSQEFLIIPLLDYDQNHYLFRSN